MIALLIAVRDFFVAVLLGWLGLVAEPADQQSQKEVALAPTATLTVFR